ncbi:MAG: ribbon-helix-helix protein, CopG family [Acidobacteriota bacterium]
MSKHRTQIQLEDWQYESLRAMAERQGRSLAGVVREAVSAYLADEIDERRDGLAAIEGIGSDEGSRGRDHDLALYSE